jgi:hypothetical protein
MFNNYEGGLSVHANGSVVRTSADQELCWIPNRDHFYFFSIAFSSFSPFCTFDLSAYYGNPFDPAPPPAAALGKHFTRIMLFDAKQARYYANMYLHEYKYVEDNGVVSCPAEDSDEVAERIISHSPGLWVFHFRMFERCGDLTPVDRCHCCTVPCL